MPTMPRVQRVVVPLLEAAFPDVRIVTWVPDIDHRVFPMLNVRRMGGSRHVSRPTQLARPVIELTAYGTEDLPTTENLYEDALEALYDAVAQQTQTPQGHLSSIRETMGATQFSSPYQDSWRIQGLIQLGVRPPRYR